MQSGKKQQTPLDLGAGSSPGRRKLLWQKARRSNWSPFILYPSPCRGVYAHSTLHSANSYTTSWLNRGWGWGGVLSSVSGPEQDHHSDKKSPFPSRASYPKSIFCLDFLLEAVAILQCFNQNNHDVLTTMLMRKNVLLTLEGPLWNFRLWRSLPQA